MYYIIDFYFVILDNCKKTIYLTVFAYANFDIMVIMYIL